MAKNVNSGMTKGLVSATNSKSASAGIMIRDSGTSTSNSANTVHLERMTLDARRSNDIGAAIEQGFVMVGERVQ